MFRQRVPKVWHGMESPLIKCKSRDGKTWTDDHQKMGHVFTWIVDTFQCIIGLCVETASNMEGQQMVVSGNQPDAFVCLECQYCAQNQCHKAVSITHSGQMGEF